MHSSRMRSTCSSSHPGGGSSPGTPSVMAFWCGAFWCGGLLLWPSGGGLLWWYLLLWPSGVVPSVMAFWCGGLLLWPSGVVAFCYGLLVWCLLLWLLPPEDHTRRLPSIRRHHTRRPPNQKAITEDPNRRP